jgi:hypothetical protein
VFNAWLAAGAAAGTCAVTTPSTGAGGTGGSTSPGGDFEGLGASTDPIEYDDPEMRC